MRDSVTIDGVTLTRQQIEDAQKRLNQLDIAPGDIVAYCGGDPRFVVMNDEHLAAFATDGTRVTPGAFASCLRSGEYTRIGTFDDVVAFYRQHHPEAK